MSRKEPIPQINENIRYDKMQLITADGENRGIVSRFEALNSARDANLDLVLIAESGGEGLPVVKVMDYGKMLYEKKKQLAEAKKHQKIIQIKEIKLRPKIGEHDYQTKINRGIEFLKEGKKLKITLMFRGREAATKNERGTILFDKVAQTFEEKGLTDNLIIEKDSKSGNMWSRIYSLKK